MPEQIHEHIAVVGDCAGCEDGTMIEETSVNDGGRRHVMLRCQDCDVESELHHDGDLENGSWSGLLNPRLKSINWIDCPHCDGYGEIEDPICDLRRTMNGREHSCPNCHGSGSVPRIVETDGGATPRDEDDYNTEELIEGHSPDDIETGEKILESPLTGNTYRVTKWVDQGDGQFIAIEKELVEDE